MNYRRMVLLVLGLVFVVAGLYMHLLDKVVVEPVVAYEESLLPGQTLEVSTAISTGDTIESPEMNWTPVPTLLPTPLVDNLMLGDKVNLASGSTALVIRLDQNSVLPGNWAESVTYDPNSQEDVFSPRLGTIYSDVYGESTILAAHSGTFGGKPSLFGSNIDFYLRKTGDSLLNLNSGSEKAEKLVGKTAFLCQTEAGKMTKLTAYDTSIPCPGQQLELKIVAVSLVSRDLVSDYEANFLNLRSWLASVQPNSGFDLLDPKNGFLLVTCVGKYPDQVAIGGVPNYDYNRLVIGFEIVK